MHIIGRAARKSQEDLEKVFQILDAAGQVHRDQFPSCRLSGPPPEVLRRVSP